MCLIYGSTLEIPTLGIFHPRKFHPSLERYIYIYIYKFAGRCIFVSLSVCLFCNSKTTEPLSTKFCTYINIYIYKAPKYKTLEITNNK